MNNVYFFYYFVPLVERGDLCDHFDTSSDF